MADGNMELLGRICHDPDEFGMNLQESSRTYYGKQSAISK
jgi:hypothetical protein